MAHSNRHHDLYIALFARTSTPRTYHWALVVCACGLAPTATTGVRYHITNSIPNNSPSLLNTPNSLPLPNPNARIPWRYEAQLLATLSTASPLLARVLISRVVGHPEDVSAALEAVPLVQDDSTWTCRVWVRDALAVLTQRGRIELPARLPKPKVVQVGEGESERVTLGADAWELVEGTCRAYLDEKHEVGRWRVAQGRWVEGEVPTWNLGEMSEIVA